MVLRSAIRLEHVTVAWMTAASLLALIFGALARSVSLTAFGLDSLVELTCALVLIRRLRAELTAGPEVARVYERGAATLVGWLLLAAACYITIDALVHLIRHQGEEFSLVGVALTLVTIPILVPLASAKLRLARELGSRALRADAIGNVVCWYLAVVVLLSLTAQFYFHAWWVDGAASAVIVGLLAVEGVQAIRGAVVTP